MSKVRITLKKSVIGSRPEHVATVKALGLRKTQSQVVKEMTPQLKGQLQAVRHLVSVEDAE
ncbi:MAG: 50S ribosomal protein L30 [Dialister sp.]|nr:50S ribosomal protein L30 [Dialister sp.]